MSLKYLALGLAFITVNAFALDDGLFYHKRSLLMQSFSIKSQALKLRSDSSLRTMEVNFFDQKLDHSDPSSVTFKQRYFVDSHFAQGAKSPVFYIVCGEWNCAGTGSYTFVEDLAKKMNAHLVALEHRYYGESLPTRHLSTKNLKHLDLQSAIDDLASFQKFMMKSGGLHGKWVVFGGSYAGTLAAFYREKHPELVAGALASSAPVLMKNEFSEYDAHVAKVINKSSCGDKVREAVKLIEMKLQTPEGSKEMRSLFKSEAIINDGDFLYVVADMLAAAVQYGRDKMFCEAFNSKADLIAAYAKGGLDVLSAMGSTPFEISLAVAERKDVTPEDNMRQWMWQSCREFGWFQVANGVGAESSRSSKIDLAYHDEVCHRLYNVAVGSDGALNEKWYYPLFNPEAGHIIFTNGSNDPWLNLSVVPGEEGKNPAFDLLMMEDAAHCNDLRLFSALPSVLAAHAQLKTIIEKWMLE